MPCQSEERKRNRQWVRWKQTGMEMETDREGDGNRRRVALSLRCTKGTTRNNHSGVVLSRLSFAPGGLGDNSVILCA